MNRLFRRSKWISWLCIMPPQLLCKYVIYRDRQQVCLTAWCIADGEEEGCKGSRAGGGCSNCGVPAPAPAQGTGKPACHSAHAAFHSAHVAFCSGQSGAFCCTIKVSYCPVLGTTSKVVRTAVSTSQGESCFLSYSAAKALSDWTPHESRNQLQKCRLCSLARHYRKGDLAALVSSNTHAALFSKVAIVMTN